MIDDSITCVMTYFMYHVIRFLENNSYVRCLMVDICKAFDRVDHAVLLGKLNQLYFLVNIYNWLIAFLEPESHHKI